MIFKVNIAEEQEEPGADRRGVLGGCLWQADGQFRVSLRHGTLRRGVYRGQRSLIDGWYARGPARARLVHHQGDVTLSQFTQPSGTSHWFVSNERSPETPSDDVDYLRTIKAGASQKPPEVRSAWGIVDRASTVAHAELTEEEAQIIASDWPTRAPFVLRAQRGTVCQDALEKLKGEDVPALLDALLDGSAEGLKRVERALSRLATPESWKSIARRGSSRCWTMEPRRHSRGGGRAVPGGRVGAGGGRRRCSRRSSCWRSGWAGASSSITWTGRSSTSARMMMYWEWRRRPKLGERAGRPSLMTTSRGKLFLTTFHGQSGGRC